MASAVSLWHRHECVRQSRSLSVYVCLPLSLSVCGQMLNNFSLSYRNLWTVGRRRRLTWCCCCCCWPHWTLNLLYHESCHTACGSWQRKEGGRWGTWRLSAVTAAVIQRAQNFWLHFAVCSGRGRALHGRVVSVKWRNKKVKKKRKKRKPKNK